MKNDKSKKNKNTDNNNKKDDLEGTVELLRKATEVCNKTKVLKEDAEFNFELIQDWSKKVEKMEKSIEEGEEIPYDQKEAILKESDTLLGRLKVSVEELRKLDVEYEALRIQVNKHYGKEVLKEHAKTPTFEEFMRLGNKEDEEEDGGEEFSF
jgi:hypothetical protein